LGKEEPLVNLGGNIIGVGEESAGYLLVEVGQEYAVFRRGQETITMRLSETDAAIIGTSAHVYTKRKRINSRMLGHPSGYPSAVRGGCNKEQ